MLCLDVYIQPQNLELALVAPNIGCLDVLEFGIGNEPQYQTTFTPPSPLHFQYRANPLCIDWNRSPSIFLTSSLSLSRAAHPQLGMAMGTRNPSTRRVLPDMKAGME